MKQFLPQFGWVDLWLKEHWQWSLGQKWIRIVAPPCIMHDPGQETTLFCRFWASVYSCREWRMHIWRDLKVDWCPRTLCVNFNHNIIFNIFMENGAHEGKDAQAPMENILTLKKPRQSGGKRWESLPYGEPHPEKRDLLCLPRQMGMERTSLCHRIKREGCQHVQGPPAMHIDGEQMGGWDGGFRKWEGWALDHVDFRNQVEVLATYPVRDCKLLKLGVLEATWYNLDFREILLQFGRGPGRRNRPCSHVPEDLPPWLFPGERRLPAARRSGSHPWWE